MGDETTDENSSWAGACSLYNEATRGSSLLRVLARLGGRRYSLPGVALLLLFHRASCASAQEVSLAGTPQQANERIRALGQVSKAGPHEYVIGNGDLLSISVFDVPELTREVRVSQTGTISIPLVPARLHVAGLTEIQTEQKIADVLEANGLVSHPEVGVAVKEHRSKPITVVGAVTHPMVYEAERSVTLLEVLAEAGGITSDAGDTVIVTRARAATFIEVPNPSPIPDAAPGASVAPGDSPALPPPDEKSSAPDSKAAFPSAQEMAQNSVPQAQTPGPAPPQPSGNIVTINLNELLEGGDTRNNIPLQAGDVVTVPHAGIVYVLGAVNKPGGFVLSNDRTQLTTMKVLALAGGLTRIAKMDHAVILRKDEQGKQQETAVDLKKVIDRQAEDLKMRASDILYVPDSRGKEVLYQALQIGMAVGSAVAIYRVAYH
jgi:polysaccharide biosynthesis/export protein